MIVSFVKSGVYLDSNVFIELYENAGEHRRRLWRLLEVLPCPGWEMVTSELSFAEVAVIPLRGNDHELCAVYEDVISSRDGLMRVIPVARTILRQAAQLRAAHAALRLPDAIHLATAVESACIALVTNDKRLRNIGAEATPAGIRIFGIDEADIDELLAFLA
jgi:predicted nucleic acid-binding protein